MTKQAHAYYSGSVQGVGFRYTAERYASSLGLVGWVKNLRDGRVEVLCEGPELSVQEFISKIDRIFGDYISDKDISWNKPSGEFETFEIRF